MGANIPVRGLNACRESCTNTGAGANANSALVERGCVRDTGKLRSNCSVSLKGIGGKNGSYLELTSPQILRWVVHQATSEVPLYTTDQVVVFGMRTLTVTTTVRRFVTVR